MEKHRILEPFKYDAAPGAALEELHSSIVNQAMEHFGWNGAADVWWQEQFDLEDGSVVRLGTYQKTESKYHCEVLLAHYTPDAATGGFEPMVYVFPEPEVNWNGEYYEHGGYVQRRSGELILLEAYRVYAYSADIHDHDTYTVSFTVKYDTKTRTLYWPEECEQS